MNKSLKRFHVSVVLFFCLIAIFAGKFVRHTIMKETLIVPAIGWNMVEKANNNIYKYGLTIKDSETDEVASSATTNAGFIFEKINFLHLVRTYYGYEILISIIWNILVFLIIISLKKSYNIIEVLFIVASITVLNIFDFTIAKEPVQMLYFILMFLVLKYKEDTNFKIFIKCVLIYFLCFCTFRSYYIIMAFYLVFIYLLHKILISKIKKVKIKHIFLILTSIFICYFVILNIAKIISNENFNELLRVRLRTSTAVSDIRATFKTTNLWIFTFDYLIVIIRMLIPVELIKLGPKYAIYTLYQIMITCIFIRNLILINKISYKRRMAVFIYIAFLLGSATFEPDFGSWIRHEAVLFPVFMIACGLDEKVNKQVQVGEEIKESDDFEK